MTTDTVASSGVAGRMGRLRGLGPRESAWILVVAVIAVVAFLVRLGLMLRGGGLLGEAGYDDSVYFSGAAALVHGRFPYRDFLFIQPPSILVALAPFAWLGTLISDARAFELARLAFMAIGAVNAVLAALLARRFGRIAGAVAGFSYAIFFPAAYSEHSTLLEPLASTLILLSLLLLGAAWSRPRLGVLIAGVVGGLSLGFKVWYVVPLAVIVVFQPGRRLLYLAGVVIAGLLAYLPFFVLAPSTMWQQVVLDQLGRPGPHSLVSALKQRLVGMSGVPTLHGALAPFTPVVFGAVVLLAVIVLGAAACTVPGARVYPALTAAGAAVILASPSYFLHYVALVAPPAAVTVGIGAGRLARLLPKPSFRIAAAVVLIALIVVANVKRDTGGVGARLPVAALRPAALAVKGCVTTDDPTGVIALDTLSRDLSHGCAFRPDVTGYTYDRDRFRVNGVEVSRPDNPRWQRDVLQYLRSGEATFVFRPLTGLSAASRAVLERGQVLAEHGKYVLRTTP
ncbi:MAG TPA: hypothetical protein VIG76_00205 [Amnibacterium sp.]|uniref:hypothetical protein n=1 Tax=Amnibacterium sp. TaxID=1872496 RepID=UPI002F92EBEE